MSGPLSLKWTNLNWCSTILFLNEHELQKMSTKNCNHYEFRVCNNGTKQESPIYFSWIVNHSLNVLRNVLRNLSFRIWIPGNSSSKVIYPEMFLAGEHNRSFRRIIHPIILCWMHNYYSAKLQSATKSLRVWQSLLQCNSKRAVNSL